MIYNLIKNIQKHIAEQRAKHALKAKPKDIVPPYQLPMIYNEIKLERLELETFISFEEMERNDISKNEAIQIAERAISLKFSEYINQRNLHHLIVEQHEWEKMYRFRAKLFIGINKPLFDKSINNIEAFKNNNNL